MDPSQFLGLISMATARDEDLVRLGTIDVLASPATKATVIFDGEDVATAKQYFVATTDNLVNGDRVILIRVGHSWLIMGKVASVSGKDAAFVETAGDTMTGNLRLEADLIIPLAFSRIVIDNNFDIEGSLTGIRFRRESTRDFITLWANDDISIMASDLTTELARFRVNAQEIRFFGPVREQDGSAGSPAYAFLSNTGSGMYLLSSSPQISVSGTRHYHLASNLFAGIGDNTKNLGTGSHRWSEVYAVNGTINTSDGREKEDIEDSDLGLDFIKALRPRRSRWKGRVRPHYVLIAQEVKSALDTLGIEDFAGYIDPAVDWEYDEEDPELSGEEPPPLGLRYHEFVSPMVKAIQELSEQVETLKAQVEVLERRPA